IVNTNVGKDITAKELNEKYDAIILACGASNPRDIKAEGRDANGIYFAVDFLSKVTKQLLDSDFKDVPYDLAKGKDVIVIGGGDTGNDCVGTCVRLGAKSVTQLEMMPEAPLKRTASNPWPEWPKVKKTDYGQEEAIKVYGHDPRIYCTTVKEFLKEKNGNLKGAILLTLKPEKDAKTGRMNMVPVEGSEKEVKAELVLIAAGFLGSEKYVTDDFKVEVNERTNVKTAPDSCATSQSKIYVAGDMHTGQSLVVKAVAQGKEVAKEVDKALMGYTNL
ncbi:MAG: FAD-dependent oxidoreductase, partial [Lachnospiraceae bacterium]|nr:FAD-dependent oxidoreductase [Lachnospiraceae bacterium]